MGSIGFEEILMIIVVAIIVFGRDLPSMARQAGRLYTKAKNHVLNMRDELNRAVEEEERRKTEPAPAPPPAPPTDAPPPPPTSA